MNSEKYYSISNDLRQVSEAFDGLGFKEIAKKILKETDCAALQDYLTILRSQAMLASKPDALDDLEMFNLIY